MAELARSDSLGDRMKSYELVSSAHLLRRCPVIVRIDGRAFHTWTRGLDKPFDFHLIDAMRFATKWTANRLQGCKLAFTQSDEASFLLTDYDTIDTQPWFGYSLAKVVSISASIFTGAFVQAATHSLDGRLAAQIDKHSLPEFDSRAFNVPEADVANYFLWRAKDWRRNSIQMAAQALFSAEQLHGVSLDMALEMLRRAKQPWEELPQILRLGSWYVSRDGQFIEPPEPMFEQVDRTISPLITFDHGKEV